MVNSYYSDQFTGGLDFFGKSLNLFFIRIQFLGGVNNDKKFEQIKYGILRSSGLLVFLLLWELSPRLNWIDRQFVPPLSTVLITIHHLWLDGSLFNHLLVSLWRAIFSLTVAVLIGLPMGFTLGRWLPGLAQVLNPLLRILGQVNPFSMMPIFILFFGIGESAKIAVVTWVCVWPVLFHTIPGIRTIDPVLIKAAVSMGVSRLNLFVKVLLPGAAPTIFTGLRIGAGLAFFMLIAAEMIGAHAGLGWFLHYSAAYYQIPRLYAAGTFIILLGIVINKLLLMLEKGLFVWKESSSVFSADVDTGKVRRVEKRHLAVIAVILLSFILLGGREVARINTQGQSFGHSGHQTHKK